MTSGDQRYKLWDDAWELVGKTTRPWELDVQARLRESLEPIPPLRVWSNFEFVDLHGATFDAHLLAFTPRGLFLLELFDASGVIDVSERYWRWTDHAGIERVADDLVVEVSERARRMRETLERFIDTGAHAPVIHPLVVVCRGDAQVRFLPGSSRVGVVGVHERSGLPDLVKLLARGEAVWFQKSGAMTHASLERTRDALEERVGLYESKRSRKVGDWMCERLLETSQNHQDYLAKHLHRPDDVRRVRVFFSPRKTSAALRSRLRNAAEREYEFLERLEHPNVLAARSCFYDQRPVITFDHPDGVERLDHFLARRGRSLNVRARLDILRRVAEAIQYAHRKGIVHRALSPASVLVREADGAREVFVYNWQAALDTRKETGTRHVLDYVAQDATLYAPPEAAQGLELGEPADVWGLGMIAYMLFAERPPASRAAELHRLLARDGMISLAASIDSVPDTLERLVASSTRASLRERTPSAHRFLELLRVHWGAQGLGSFDGSSADPLDAQPGQRLDDAFDVVSRLGSGASAVALLVEDASARQVVLKIARTDNDAVRLEAERDELDRFADESLVVDCEGIVDVGDRRALVLEFGGQTLRERLRGGRLSLDDLRRFGADLCAISCALEERHVWHRDIKPANIGIGGVKNTTQRLKLFDFSLARAAADSIQVGTDAYRDPMLLERGRWDEAADRWGVAATLLEMATGAPPTFPKDLSPAYDDWSASALFEPDRLPVGVRADLDSFFKRALARETSSRFETAIDMRRDWERVFEETTHTEDEAVDATVARATRDTGLADLEVSPVALEALARMDLYSVGQLVDANPQGIFFQKGTSGQVRAELRRLRDKLLTRLGSMVTHVDLDDQDPATMSLDRCLEYAAFNAHRKSAELERLQALLGIGTDASPWRDRQTLASDLGKVRSFIDAELDWAAGIWSRQTNLRPLRDDAVELVARDGVVSSFELARALLAWRRSASPDPLRLEIAHALVRVIAEAERVSNTPRLTTYRIGEGVFVSTIDDPLPALLPNLAAIADGASGANPLFSEHRLHAALCEECLRAHITPPPMSRLVPLAIAASSRAVLSKMKEVYPRAMPAVRALKLCAGMLSTGDELTVDALADRVSLRYPHAEPLPRDSAALGLLLAEANLAARWDSGAAEGKGAFCTAPHSSSMSSGAATSSFSRLDLRALDVDAFDDDLARALEWGGFRVVMVSPGRLEAAERAVLARFSSLTRVNVDALWLDALERAAAEDPVKPSLEQILKAASPSAPSHVRFRFEELVRRAASHLEGALDAHAGADVLLVHPGLLGRYEGQGGMQVLERWRDRANTPEGPRALWTLLVADRQSDSPRIDGHAVPRIGRGEVARLPGTWIAAKSP